MKKYAFGIDIGGTTVKCGLFLESGELLEKWEIPTDVTEKGTHILDDIAATIAEKLNEKELKKEDVLGIGVGVPGPVLDDGTIISGTNLGWGRFNVKEALEEKAGISVKVQNDANIAALGECWQGGGKGKNNIVMVTLGTGVGGGVILGGKIVTGVHGAGGEIGHIPVNDEEEAVCGCGKKGCLEQYASATGIVRMANQKIVAYQGETTLSKLEKITAKDIFDAARDEDAFAKELTIEVGNILGKVLATMSCVIDVDAYVIGGGVSRAGEVLLAPIRNAFTNYAFHASKETQIVQAELGNDAGIYGAVGLFLSESK